MGALLGLPSLALAEARWVEPGWIRKRRLRLRGVPPRQRLVHITDLHHKGDRSYLQHIVKEINALSPEFVCFTGDLIEEREHLDEALRLLSEIQSPLYGVPGNHDYWAAVPFANIAECFAATGGAWLLDQATVTRDGKFTILGAACVNARQPPLQKNPRTRNILLMHYPAWVKNLSGQTFDLMLAGHSHGGQVRIPLHGPLMLPFGVDEYDLGLFETPSGPLYVSSGLGWFPIPVRFNCRPEIAVIEL